jgi:thiosulfate/3-mercaptopyruvate sulfurtransferase
MEKPVVIYDAENGMFAARAWWLLAYYGHEKTYVLDGGYKAWVEQGYDVTAENPSIAPSSFQPNINLAMTVTMEEVKVHDPEQSIVIDSRARARYLGETEPLYKKAGHIPGAKNYVWQHVLTDEGVWKSQEQLVEHFGDLPKHKEIIVSCGSGISACPNIIALKQAGFEHVKLYPGSFSDWISYEANPVEKGEQ